MENCNVETSDANLSCRTGKHMFSQLTMGSGAPSTFNERTGRVSTTNQPERTDMNSLLSDLAVNRNKEIFSRLYSHFAPRLKSMLMGTGTDPETAEEVAQEAMITVWRKCEMYDPSKSAASTWVFTIARNLRIDRFRKEKRPQLDPNDPSLLPEEDTPADEQLDINDRQVVIRNAVNELPDEQREVVALSFKEGLSHQEISDRLDLPLGTVKSRLRLSFEKLRTNLRSQV